MTDNSYIKWRSYSDDALLQLIGAYIRHHRLEQNKTQTVVAKAAGISRSTLSLLEKGEPVNLATLIQVLRVLDQLSLLAAFEVNTEVSPIAIAKMQQQMRQRASSPTIVNEPKSDW